MKWSYDMAGAEPIIKDELIYDATSITQGEILMLGTTAFASAADAGVALVSATPDTVGANAGVGAVGICLETKTTAGSPAGSAPTDTVSVATAHNVTTALKCYGKTIINPFAVYRAEMLTSSAAAVGASGTASKVTITGIAASTCDGCWVYFQASAGPARGQLRMITASATAGSALLDTTNVATPTNADTVLLIGQRNRVPHNLSGGGDTVGAGYTITQTVGFAATNFRIMENYIDRGQGMEILRYNVHRQISGLPQTTKFYQDIVMIDHAFNT